MANISRSDSSQVDSLLDRVAELEALDVVQASTEASLRQSRHFLQATLDALSAHIAVLDEAGTILAVNRAWSRFAEENGAAKGVSDIGRNYLAVCRGAVGPDAEAAQEIANGILAVLKGEVEKFSMEYPCHSPTQKRWFIAHVTRFREEGRSYLVVAHEDITPLKLAEEALIHHAQELTRSNAELERFAYVASHDLQEPLRMVVSFTQLLSRRYRGRLDQDADEFIGYAIDGAYRMQQLINDLLAYSRLGSRGVEFAPVDCGSLVSQVIEDLRTTLQETGGEITYASLPIVNGDSTQLRQLFQNLIANGLKFHSETAPKIHVSARREKSFWHFSVSDNGIGIQSQHFERIFIMFQRLHTHSEYPGSGVGLALCKKIVFLHGGKIWLDSQPGSGSIFHFTLPIIGEAM